MTFKKWQLYRMCKVFVYVAQIGNQIASWVLLGRCVQPACVWSKITVAFILVWRRVSTLIPKDELSGYWAWSFAKIQSSKYLKHIYSSDRSSNHKQTISQKDTTLLLLFFFFFLPQSKVCIRFAAPCYNGFHSRHLINALLLVILYQFHKLQTFVKMALSAVRELPNMVTPRVVLVFTMDCSYLYW